MLLLQVFCLIAHNINVRIDKLGEFCQLSNDKTVTTRRLLLHHTEREERERERERDDDGSKSHALQQQQQQQQHQQQQQLNRLFDAAQAGETTTAIKCKTKNLVTVCLFVFSKNIHFFLATPPPPSLVFVSSVSI